MTEHERFIHMANHARSKGHKTGIGWLMLYKDTATNYYFAYDTKDTLKCLKVIAERHPTYRFIGCKPVATMGEAVELCKALRIVNKNMAEILEFEAIANTLY